MSIEIGGLNNRGSVKNFETHVTATKRFLGPLLSILNVLNISMHLSPKQGATNLLGLMLPSTPNYALDKNKGTTSIDSVGSWILH